MTTPDNVPGVMPATMQTAAPIAESITPPAMPPANVTAVAENATTNHVSNMSSFFKEINYFEVAIFTAILTTSFVYIYSKYLDIKAKKEQLQN